MKRERGREDVALMIFQKLELHLPGIWFSGTTNKNSAF
jgi:hypothetical protein